MADSEQCSALPCPCQCQGKIRAPKEKEKKLRFKPITCQPRSSQSLQGKHPPGSSPPAKVSNASKEWRCQGKAQAAANAGNQRLPPVWPAELASSSWLSMCCVAKIKPTVWPAELSSSSDSLCAVWAKIDLHQQWDSAFRIPVLLGLPESYCYTEHEVSNILHTHHQDHQVTPSHH